MGVFRTKFVTENVEKRREREREREGEAQNTSLHDKFSKIMFKNLKTLPFTINFQYFLSTE